MNFESALNGRVAVAAAPPSERAVFVRRTYLHLLGAVLGFIGIEAALFGSGMAESLIKSVFIGRGGGAWIVLMLLFMGGGFVARVLAQSSTSDALRYMGLSMYVMLEAVIFLPILYIAEQLAPGQHLPLKAGLITAAAFAGLTFATVSSGRDFSFLGPMLWVAGWVFLAAIILAVFTGSGVGLIGLGLSAFGVFLAAGYIVYDTSNVMHHYGPDQYVAAALELFASVALMFYYVLRILIALRDD